MEFFPDRIHVRLRSRVTGAYLHADEDGVRVSLRWRRASLNTAWAVHRTVRDGITYVLLHGAAYGRYLALSPVPAPHGLFAVQRDYSELELNAVMWLGVMAAGEVGNYVVVRHISNRVLRANGRFRRWDTAVTVDYFDWSNMMHWRVEAIPPRPEPPLLPVPGPTQNLRGRFALFLQRADPVVERARLIRCFGADNLGNFELLGTFQFYGRSVFNLRSEVAFRVNQVIFSGITVCVRAGFYGRPTPLVIDLPRNEETMDIVVLTTGSPAAAELRYPDV
ncbi:uncharacterized protein LOC133883441 [Phragmites australis]|uniref:uncharacterized protein LOC133883441 n=1 Tax=Phragmites australis TaxID=29695 RepID=UPI002D794BCE|nr:uncharacterized protein LOC133883441 [Phragmites australis]